MSTAIALGAPGVHVLPVEPARDLAAVPMDECVFAGLASRGPAWEPVRDPAVGVPRLRSVPVAVASVEEYAERFGPVGGPGLLGRSVQAFFRQGGRRAHVVRIVSREAGGDGLPAGRARLRFDPAGLGPGGPVDLYARSEGAWGDHLSATIAFRGTRLPGPPRAVGTSGLALGDADPVPVGSLLRMIGAGGVGVLRAVTAIGRIPRADAPRTLRVATLDGALPAGLLAVEVVSGVLAVRDADPALPRAERFEGLGLVPEHPRWLGDVLQDESRLVELAPGVTRILPAGPALADAWTRLETGGADRFHLVDERDFFWDEGREVPGDGLLALDDVPQAALVVAPDLVAWRRDESGDVADRPGLASTRFEPCVTPAGRPAPPHARRTRGLERLELEPGLPASTRAAIARQQQLVAAARRTGAIALLDVPPWLAHRDVLAWRGAFASAFAAAYHPWPTGPATAGGPSLPVPPSAAAAGVIAATERRRGLPAGPANAVVAGATGVMTRLIRAQRDELHVAGVNVLVADRDGVRLVAARTLSPGGWDRQLSARRVVTMVARTLERRLQWVAFEPDTPALRGDVATLVRGLLEDLFRQGAFAGATPDLSFFVHLETGPGMRAESDLGRLLCQVGLRTSEPIEHIVLGVRRLDDGAIAVEALDG